MNFRRTVAAFLLLIGTSCAAYSAQSSRPLETEQDKQAAKRQQEATDQLRTIATELRAIREKQAETERRVARYESDERRGVFGPPIWPDISVIAVGTLAAVIALLTLGAIRDQVEANHLEAIAAKASADGLKNAERAYVGLRTRQHGEDWGHLKDIGFHQRPWKDEAPVGQTRYKLEVRLANSGRTPAHIHGGVIEHWPRLHRRRYSPPSTIPTEGRNHIPGNFLHAGGYHGLKLIYMLSDADIAAIGEQEMWLVGYVDYSDAFRIKHRAGFCRRVGTSTDKTRNNLFIDLTCEPYNYDCEIDEGGNCKEQKQNPAPPAKRWWQKRLRWS